MSTEKGDLQCQVTSVVCHTYGPAIFLMSVPHVSFYNPDPGPLCTNCFGQMLMCGETDSAGAVYMLGAVTSTNTFPLAARYIRTLGQDPGATYLRTG